MSSRTEWLRVAWGVAGGLLPRIATAPIPSRVAAIRCCGTMQLCTATWLADCRGVLSCAALLLLATQLDAQGKHPGTACPALHCPALPCWRGQGGADQPRAPQLGSDAASV
jgi:hypothetical protein